MTPPVIAAFYAGLNALIILWLAFAVIGARRRSRVSLGDGGNETLNRLIRGHANAVETIPIALILLALSEILGAPVVALHVFGLSLTFGRMAHALYFTGRAPMSFRLVGMVLTFTAMAAPAIGLIIITLPRMFV